MPDRSLGVQAKDIAVIAALPALLVVSTGVGIGSTYATDTIVTCTATSVGHGTGSQRGVFTVQTEQCGTLANDRSVLFWKGKGTVSSINEQIVIGSPQRVRIAGWRWEAVGKYPNIIEVSPATP